MAWDITEGPLFTIEITDGWIEHSLPMLTIWMVVDEPYITIYWADSQKGRTGVTRSTGALDYNDITFGYVTPSSASEVELEITNMIEAAFGGSGGTEWGDITGTLSDQTDLQAALDAKLTDSDAAVGARINASAAATPNDTDFVATAESGGSLKKITWTNVKAFLKTYFDTIYQAILVSGTNIKTVNNITLLGAGNLSTPQSAAVLYTSNNPATGATRYFGNKPGAPSATGGQNKIYLRRAVTIIGAEIYAYATATAGSNENISFYVRVNDTTDTLIQTVGVAAAERIFTNHSLSINLGVGDYFEIKRVNPTWGTPPTAEIAGGYILYQLQ